MFDSAIHSFGNMIKCMKYIYMCVCVCQCVCEKGNKESKETKQRNGT